MKNQWLRAGSRNMAFALVGLCAFVGCMESIEEPSHLSSVGSGDDSSGASDLIAQLRRLNAEVRTIKYKGDRECVWVDLGLVQDKVLALRLAARLENVDRLSLQGAELTSQDFTLLRRMPALRWLDLSNSSVSDSDLAFLESTPRIEFLLLWSTSISDEGLKHLARLDRLQKLDLSDTRITSAGLPQLAELLELLELYVEVPGISDADIRPVQATLPHALIVF